MTPLRRIIFPSRATSQACLHQQSGLLSAMESSTAPLYLIHSFQVTFKEDIISLQSKTTSLLAPIVRPSLSHVKQHSTSFLWFIRFDTPLRRIIFPSEQLHELACTSSLAFSHPWQTAQHLILWFIRSKTHLRRIIFPFRATSQACLHQQSGLLSAMESSTAPHSLIHSIWDTSEEDSISLRATSQSCLHQQSGLLSAMESSIATHSLIHSFWYTSEEDNISLQRNFTSLLAPAVRPTLSHGKQHSTSFSDSFILWHFWWG